MLTLTPIIGQPWTSNLLASVKRSVSPALPGGAVDRAWLCAAHGRGLGTRSGSAVELRYPNHHLNPLHNPPTPLPAWPRRDHHTRHRQQHQLHRCGPQCLLQLPQPH
jgi:hypothetical protein